MSNPNIARDSSKTFKKGQSGNPKGKKPGTVSLTTAIKKFLISEATDGETYESKLSRAIVLRALSKSDVLAKELLDRTDGKVTQPIGGDPDHPIVIKPLSTLDELRQDNSNS